MSDDADGALILLPPPPSVYSFVRQLLICYQSTPPCRVRGDDVRNGEGGWSGRGVAEGVSIYHNNIGDSLFRTPARDIEPHPGGDRA